MVNSQTIKRTVLHVVLSGVLLFSLGAVVLSPQPVSAMPPNEYALSFNGTTDYVDCGSGASLDITEAITIEAWVKITDNSGTQVIVDKRNGPAELNYLVRLNNGYLKFTFYNGGYRDLQDDTTQLANNTLYYIAVTYDRANIRLYVNGAEVKSVGETDAMIPDASPLTIGKQAYSNSSYFNGLLDEVRISDTARTPGEITDSWNGGVGERFVLDGNTVALWYMNEGSETTINDETINANHGTIYGAVWAAPLLVPGEEPGVISQIVFTNPERTVLVNEAAEMTIQTLDAADTPTPVTGNTPISLDSTSGTGQFSAELDPWTPTSSVTIWDTQSLATFYYRNTAIGTPTIAAAADPGLGWTQAEQVVTVQGPVELWRGEELIGTYFTIQEAIDNASDGDDIIVLPGTYDGQIRIDKQITVKSSDGAATTIIDAQFGTDVVCDFGGGVAAYPAVWIKRDGVVFGDLDTGFTIRNTPPMVFPEGAEEPSEWGVAILADASGVTIRGNTIEDSNPIGIFADVDTVIISQNTVEGSLMGIFGGSGGGSILYNEVNSAYYGIIIESHAGNNNISNNTVCNSWGCAIMVQLGDDNQITNNTLLDSQGMAISLQDTSNATVSGNLIVTDTTDVAGIYGIDVQGGENNNISGNTIEYVLVDGIILNNTSDNNLSGNEIWGIYGYDLSWESSGEARWTREQAMFMRFSVKLETGEDPSGVARLEIPTISPFKYAEIGGGLRFWAYYLPGGVTPLPTYQLELDVVLNGVVTLEGYTDCEGGPRPDEWLSCFTTGMWKNVDTTETKPLSEWINDFPGAKIVKRSVVYAGDANWTVYIDGSHQQEGLEIEPPKGIAIARSNRNSVSDSLIVGVDGAGVLIVESNQNTIGDNNEIVENGTGIIIENSNENTVRGSLIAANYKEGIRIRHSYNNQIIGNDIVWNMGDNSGIHLDGESGGIEIHANNIYDNTPRDGEGNIIRDEDDNIISYGVCKEGGDWVNASGNWWGDPSGPYHEWRNPGGMGDAVSNECVHFEPWATTELPEYELPTIAEGGSLAMPQMTAVLGMFMGDVGPEWTSLVVEAWDNEGGVGIAQVTVNLLDLLMQMLPEEPEIPPEKQEQWDKWLSELERSHLRHQDHGVYQRNFHLKDEFIKQLRWYLDEEDTQRIMEKLTLGDFSIPVTVADWCGNESYSYIDLTIVDIMQPLKEGWNLISTPVTLDGSYAALADIFDLGGGSIGDVLVDIIRYDPTVGEFGEWVSAGPDDELKPLSTYYIYVSGNTQIGGIFNREPTLPPMLNLEGGWNLVGLAIPPTDWDSMPVNEAMVTVEQASGIRGYSIVVSPDQRVDYKEEYRYRDTEDREYGFGGYDWRFEQSPWVYTVGSADIKEMSIGGGYWVFMEEADTLAGFSTTPVTRVFLDEPGHDLDPLVPRYDWERVSRTAYEEYRDGGYTKIYLTYSGNASPSRVVEFYQQRMPEYGWELTAWEGSEGSASLDFTRVAGPATFSCHIDVVGGESIDILFELWEPGVDLPDVLRFEWWPVAMTAYSQITDSTGTQTNINYEGELDPEWVYKFYQNLKERLQEKGYQEYNWEQIGNEDQNEFAWLMFRRNDEEGRTYICLIWVEKGLIEIEHHQFAASVPGEYIDAVIDLWRQKIEMRMWGWGEEEEPQPPG